MKNQAAFWLAGLALTTAQVGGSASPPGCLLSRHMDLAGVQKRLTAAEALWKRWEPDAYRMDIIFEGEPGNFHFQLSVPRRDSA